MTIDINSCDLDNDYFHFTNKDNIYNILDKGLIPSIGTASELVGDRPNVSISKGGKGIMGIINYFIYVFSTRISISEIPEEYRKYFTEISDFTSNDLMKKDMVYKAIIRKLKDEVYFRVQITEEQLDEATIGGLTGFDIKLPMAINKSQVSVIANSDNQILSAFDVAMYIYEKAKNIEVFRTMHEDFFGMFENKNQEAIIDYNEDIAQRQR